MQSRYSATLVAVGREPGQEPEVVVVVQIQGKRGMKNVACQVKFAMGPRFSISTVSNSTMSAKIRRIMMLP